MLMLGFLDGGVSDWVDAHWSFEVWAFIAYFTLRFLYG
jgi:hypothetical protein